MRVLYMSGYADAAMLPDAAPIAVVPKPFSEETLVRLVREALDQPLGASAEAIGLTGAAPE
jgi:hypothetical protein